MDEEQDDDLREEIWIDLHVGSVTSLLTRMPNLRIFGFILFPLRCYKFGIYSDFDSILLALKQKQDLQAVWFQNHDRYDLRDVDPGTTFGIYEACRTVEQMKRLKFLSLVHVDGESSMESYCLSDISPPSSLKSLCIGMNFFLDGDCQPALSWLLRPRDDFCLHDLFLTDGGMTSFRVVASILASSGCLPFIQRISICSRNELQGSIGDALHQVMSQCSSLQTFHLGMPTRDGNCFACSDGRQLHLPTSLEYLSVAVNYHGETLQTTFEHIDRNLLSLLEANSLPRLKKLSVDDSMSRAARRGSLRRDLLDCFPLTKKCCADYGYIFSQSCDIGHGNSMLDSFENTELGWMVR